MDGIRLTERKNSRYGAIEVPDRAVSRPEAASRSSRRCPAGNVSGQKASRRVRPSSSRQRRKASGPRQTTARSRAGRPSTVGAVSPTASTISRAGLRPSRRASCSPQASKPNATGHATARGISEASTAHGASNANEIRITTRMREGRHATLAPGVLARVREGADRLDECVEFGICGTFMTEEPLPQPIVLAVQQQ